MISSLCTFAKSCSLATVYFIIQLVAMVRATVIMIKKKGASHSCQQFKSREELHAYYKKHYPAHYEDTCIKLSAVSSRYTTATEKPCKRSLISRLPNEILNEVFDLLEPSDLSQATSVSRHWHQLITPNLWKTAAPPTAFLQCTPALAIADKRQNAIHYHSKSLTLPQFPLHKPKYGHAVRDLDLTRFSGSVSDCYIRYIANHCPNLRHLTLSSCHYLTDDSLFYISRGFPHLKTLSLHGCNRITDKGLSFLAAGRLSLQTVDLSGCINISETGVMNLVRSSYGHLTNSSSKNHGKGKVSSSIRRLWLNDCRFKVTSKLLRFIGRTCNTRLEWLGIARCGDNDMDNMYYGGIMNTKRDNENIIRQSDIQQLLIACPNITRLDLTSKTVAARTNRNASAPTQNSEEHPLTELISLFQRLNMEHTLSIASQMRLQEIRLRQSINDK